ncbi:hypothetical protein FHU13_005620 [Methylobacterium sp. R2-1]|nr:hypothetical protein [Methylobacterium sp. R2-1]
MTTDPPCPRRDKWFRGCRFEPRYDTPQEDRYGLRGMWQSYEVHTNPDGETCTIKEPPAPTKRYVRDVCTRCGKVVDRGGAR